MGMPAYSGIVRGGVVQFDEASTALAEGTKVTVFPLGSPQALLAAVSSFSPVPQEWVDELNAAIRESREHATGDDPFADWPDEPGSD